MDEGHEQQEISDTVTESSDAWVLHIHEDRAIWRFEQFRPWVNGTSVFLDQRVNGDGLVRTTPRRNASSTESLTTSRECVTGAQLLKLSFGEWCSAERA